MTSQADIDRVLAEHPSLGVHGFEINPPLRPGAAFIEEVRAARGWLSSSPARRTLLLKTNSYLVKHLIEADVRSYISNGAAIVAATLEGFQPVRAPTHRNCRFTSA